MLPTLGASTCTYLQKLFLHYIIEKHLARSAKRLRNCPHAPHKQRCQYRWAVVENISIAKNILDLNDSRYALSPTSPYLLKGTDGKDLGADLAAVRLLTAGVKQPK